MLDTLQRPSSFNDSDPFSANATHTISSTLDDLQLDITLQIHERICAFAFGGKEGEEVAAQGLARKWDENSPPPYLKKGLSS